MAENSLERSRQESLVPDPRETAKAAGLRYVTDEEPGITRRRRGRGWSYHRPDGSLIEDPDERERIEALAIPPAWTDVWIRPHPDCHLQATGRDDRSRKQYRYHPAWQEAREELKFTRLAALGRALPQIRRGVREALETEGLNRERVLATVVALLEKTAIRVGNDEYARENDTYGLTTLRRRHVTVRGSTIAFEFEAKGGKDVEVEVEDERLAPIVAACSESPGYEVFKWIDPDGDRRDVKSGDVNEFLFELSEEHVSAKDFRTWLGTLHAFCQLCGCEEASDEAEIEAQALAAVDAVADLLRNTREVARDAYVHPVLLELHREGKLRSRWPEEGPGEVSDDLSPAEEALLALLDDVNGSG